MCPLSGRLFVKSQSYHFTASWVDDGDINNKIGAKTMLIIRCKCVSNQYQIIQYKNKLQTISKHAAKESLLASTLSSLHLHANLLFIHSLCYLNSIIKQYIAEWQKNSTSLDHMSNHRQADYLCNIPSKYYQTHSILLIPLLVLSVTLLPAFYYGHNFTEITFNTKSFRF